MDLVNGTDYDDYVDPCLHTRPESGRFVLVGVIGTSVALVSTVENAFLFSAWITNPRRRTSHFLYLIFLAFCDTFISVSYILLIAVNVFMDWYEVVALVRFWWLYMVPMLTISHVTMTTSSFFITAATIERFLITSKTNSYSHKVAQNHRFAISMLCLFAGLAFKGAILFEIETRPMPNCTGLTEFFADLSELAKSENYNTIYRFWLRNICTVLIPFFLCLYFNWKVIRVLTKQARKARLFRFGTTEHKVNIRSASRMLVLVTCTYLISNILNVVITVWEFVDHQSLYDPKYRRFYAYSSDVISVLTVLASSLRLPIYCACNAQIRHELFNFLTKRCIKIDAYWSMAHETEMAVLVNGCSPAPSPFVERRTMAQTDFDRFVVGLALSGSALSFTQSNVASPVDSIEREYLV